MGPGIRRGGGRERTLLFNSYEFLFVFLPVTLAGFFALGRRSHGLAMGWLVAASLFFYGWWYAPHLGLLLVSVGFNFAAGLVLSRTREPERRHRLLILAVAGDLLLLGYFKYAGLLVATADALLGQNWSVPAIALPLGISFFTLTQIAFLADTAQREARDYKFVHYLLFVSYFPHLIAGPILHHKELMPQLDRADIVRFSARRLALGLSYFAIGLFKKTFIADSLSLYSGQVFDNAAHGVALSAAEAWGGVLAYTLQIYFDFSGYSDMAIGLARMIGVRLPLNFHSPYKATSIIDFWRRWHMTLSRFLRDYLYIPLGGNRHGTVRRYVNLMLTMLIGGLWHGAAWTFVLWGGLHGLYLVVNHLWRALRGERRRRESAAGRVAAGLLTFICVAVAWVPFRANGPAATGTILAALAGWHGLLPVTGLSQIPGILGEGPPRWIDSWKWVGVLLPLVWLLPNTQEFFSRYRTLLPPVDRADRLLLPLLNFRWRLSSFWAYATAFIAAVAVLYCSRASEFIYFQF
jgi:D-alanyl-lipoteichoic acid acyltransferase DltB (MBOAT superfamily)